MPCKHNELAAALCERKLIALTYCRHYTTPQSYLDLIELYKGLLKGQRSATGEARERLLNGLAKLSETNEQVEQMRGELSVLQPVIKEKSQARPTIKHVSRLICDRDSLYRSTRSIYLFTFMFWNAGSSSDASRGVARPGQC